jgi:hypothetical protein
VVLVQHRLANSGDFDHSLHFSLGVLKATN